MTDFKVVEIVPNDDGMTMAMLAAQALGMNPQDSSPSAIVASEKAGQAQFVASATLPVDMRGVTIAELESLGFTFGDESGLFVAATLPPGWSKKGGTHDMWSYIHDDQGKERASVFYKAAWYDQSATLYWKE